MSVSANWTTNVLIEALDELAGEIGGSTLRYLPGRSKRYLPCDIEVIARMAATRLRELSAGFVHLDVPDRKFLEAIESRLAVLEARLEKRSP